jgi:hypothetical protein
MSVLVGDCKIDLSNKNTHLALKNKFLVQKSHVESLNAAFFKQNTEGAKFQISNFKNFKLLKSLKLKSLKFEILEI